MNDANSGTNALQKQTSLTTIFEIAPVGLYFLSYVAADWFFDFGTSAIFVATAVFIVATVLAVAGSAWLTRRIPILPLVSAIPLAIFGGVGVVLHDDALVKIRPTVINGLFGFVLLGGLIAGRPLLRYVFCLALDLTDEGWRKMTLRWGLFCLLMAGLNEVVRFISSDGWWVIYDTWISTALTLLFTFAQYPLIVRHEKAN